MTRYQFHGLSNSDFVGLDRQESILAEITADQMSSSEAYLWDKVMKEPGSIERARRNEEGRHERVTCKTLEESNTLEDGLSRVRLWNSW